MTGDDLYRVYLAAERDGYPAEWHAFIKTDVRDQAGSRCVRCGHPYTKAMGEWSLCDEHCTHGGPIRYRFGDEDWCDFGRLAENGWKPYEGPSEIVRNTRALLATAEVQARWRILTVHHLNGIKLDCRWWNLAPLCQRCHLTIQGKVQMDRIYPFEHSEWFKPYAAGFYAWRYLGENLTREQVAGRLDELLALERLA